MHLRLSAKRNCWKWSALLFYLKICVWMSPRSALIAPITVIEGPRSLIMESFMLGVIQHLLAFICTLTVVSSTYTS